MPLSRSAAAVISDAMGWYSFSGLASGQKFTVTATAAGWTFANPGMNFAPLTASRTDADPAAVTELPPDLHLSPGTTGTVVLSWPDTASGWTLLTSNTLAGGSWLVAPAPVVDIPGWHTVTVPESNRAFFRLEK